MEKKALMMEGMEGETGKKKDLRDKFTVNLTPEVKAAFAELTEAGFVVGRLVNELLEDSVPIFKELARAARAAKSGKQLSIEEFAGSMFHAMGDQMAKKSRRGRRKKKDLVEG